MFSDNDWRNQRSKRPNASSPRDKPPPLKEREQHGLFMRTSSKDNLVAKAPSRTAMETPRTAQFRPPRPGVDMPRNLAISTEHKNSSGLLPPNSSLVKVIHEGGQTSVCDVDGIRSAEEMVARIHRQARLSEPSKNYQFFVMDGTEANYANCRRLSNAELFAIGSDTNRHERQRLIIRKISYGDPEGPQLVKASEIAKEQLRATTSPSNILGERSMQKIKQLTGEPITSLPPVSYPMSPASLARREEHLNSAAIDLESSDPSVPTPRPRPRKVDSFMSGRPESQFVMNDPATFFPINKEEVNRAVRMSIRRSARLSRANSRLSQGSRLSTASTFSVGSNPSSSDVPAVPAIPASFANGESTPVRPRPLSILRLGRPTSHVRDSVASSALDPLDEESSYEPNRKSYVSFGDSAPGSATASISEHDSKTAIHIDPTQRGDPSTSSYLEDGGSSPLTENGSSIGEQIREALETDGEEPDPELNDFLTGANSSWDNIKYIKGKLIGQGSFGSVYMALHAVTAELMAVKQVELPSTAGTAVDAKKNNMIEALKREIALLRELKHRHIVQYLGSSSDGNNLNIFLEYVPGGSIAKMLVDWGALSETIVSRLTRQILIGLAYLHSKDIIHRDIKGANILVDTHGAVKISDFGISKRVQDSKTLLSESSNTSGVGSGTRPGRGAGLPNNRVSMQGSVFWMAPEVVKQTAYTRKADIWSVGCLVVEMLTGSHPHPNLSQLQAIFKIGGNRSGSDPSPDVPRDASKECRDFLEKTFRVEHESRPEAEELIGMPLIRNAGTAGGEDGRRGS